MATKKRSKRLVIRRGTGRDAKMFKWYHYSANNQLVGGGEGQAYATKASIMRVQRNHYSDWVQYLVDETLQPAKKAAKKLARPAAKKK